MKPSTSHQPRWTVLAALAMSFAVGCAGAAPLPDDDSTGDTPPPEVKEPPIPKEGTATSPGCNGVTELGTCSPDGTKAIRCDLATDKTTTKDCKALGKVCLKDATRGAACQTAPAPTGGGGSTPCATGVTFEGSCTGTGNQTAVWCDTDTNQTMTWDCAVEGMTCTTNTCATGAFCCSGTGTTTPPPTTSVCPALGLAGKCETPTKAIWCYGDAFKEMTCTGTQTCQVDACATGAYCCSPPQTAPATECEMIGYRGVCTTAGKVRYCSSGTVLEYACMSPETCQVDSLCGDGANCCL